MAVRLKDQSLAGLHQQLARDFLSTHLYGPDSNRVKGKQFSIGGSASRCVLNFVINTHLYFSKWIFFPWK